MVKLRRSIALLAALCMAICLLPSVQTNAATEGYLTYEISDGEVTITDCDTAASGDITIPDTIENCPVTAIGADAFRECRSLTGVTIPESVTTIGANGFYYCSSLASVTIPDSVTDIGSYAFYNCSSLTTAAISSKLTSISLGMFYGCRSLNAVTIPAAVTAIGNSAFEDCSSLTGITIPEGVTTLGRSVFDGCNRLTGIWVEEDNAQYSSDEQGVLFNKDKTSLLRAPCGMTGGYTVPGSVTEIGARAFHSCSGLTSVAIPDSVTTVSEYAFHNCTDLAQVIFCGTESQWETIAISEYNTPLTEAARQLHDYEDGVCTCCGLNVAAADLNGDGKLTVFDAQILAEAKAGLRTLTEEQLAAVEGLQVAEIKDYILGKD